MDAAARLRLVVSGSAVLAVGLTWSILGVVSLPAIEDGNATVRVWGPPEQSNHVHGLVAKFRAADRSDIDSLRELAESEDPLVAGNAIGALGRLGEVDADSDLVDKLDDPRPRIRHEVVAALGLGGDPAAARHLEPLLRSGDVQTRLLAIQSLAQLGVNEPLQALVKDPATDPGTKAFARAASRPPLVPELLATTSGLRDR